MFRTVIVLVAVAIFAATAEPKAKASVLGAYAAAPVIAPAVVTAQSSQVIARNYNALAAAPLVVAAPYRAAPVVAAPYVAPYAASYAATYAAPYAAALAAPYAAAPYVAAPYAAPYAAAPYLGAPLVGRAAPYVTAPRAVLG